MKHLIVIVMTVLLSDAAFAAPNDFRCFKSTDAQQPILLQFEFPQGKRSVGYVWYRRGSRKIPVRLIATSTLETSPGRPLEFTTKWKEIAQGGYNGTYSMVTQGARVYGFTFVRAKDNKTFEFEEDLDSSGEHRCEWNKK